MCLCSLNDVIQRELLIRVPFVPPVLEQCYCPCPSLGSVLVIALMFLSVIYEIRCWLTLMENN